jgi:hypothetical protein
LVVLRKGKRRAPSNIFTGTDLYTLHHKSGKKNYAIEETLSNLEGRYATVFREKITPDKLKRPSIFWTAFLF